MTATAPPRNALERALRDFELVFWVGLWGDQLERLYEPDGTLYAICLEGPVVVATDRRKVTVNRGDLVILPPAVAVELDKPVRWFGLVYAGPYPYHFRERFIQVWGFEHVRLGIGAENSPSPVADANFAGFSEPPGRDLRHRMYVSAVDSPSTAAETGPELRLDLTLDDMMPEGFRVNWRLTGASDDTATEPVDATSFNPGGSTESLTAIRFEIPLEAVYLAHREARPAPVPSQTMSPEYHPERNH